MWGKVGEVVGHACAHVLKMDRVGRGRSVICCVPHLLEYLLPVLLCRQLHRERFTLLFQKSVKHILV